MERAELIDLVQQKHKMRIDPDDPVFIAATAFEALHKDARRELRELTRRTDEAVNRIEAIVGKVEVLLGDEVRHPLEDVLRRMIAVIDPEKLSALSDQIAHDAQIKGRLAFANLADAKVAQSMHRVMVSQCAGLLAAMLIGMAFMGFIWWTH